MQEIKPEKSLWTYAWNLLENDHPCPGWNCTPFALHPWGAEAGGRSVPGSQTALLFFFFFK